MHPLKWFVLSWICVSAGAAQQASAAGAVGAAQVVTGEVSVAPSEQFCPTYVIVKIVAAGDAAPQLVGFPVLKFARKEADGQWYPARSLEAGPEEQITLPGFVGQSEQARWALGGGQAVEFWIELSDWRIVAYPATYRVDAQWGTRRGEEDRRATCEFVVTPTLDAQSTLTAAQSAHSDIWRGYKEVMSTRLELAAPVAQSGSGSGAARTLSEQLNAATSDPMRRLESSGELPQKVKDRVTLLRLDRAYRVAGAGASGAAQQLEKAQVLSEYAVLGTRPGYFGAFARLQRIALLSTGGNAADLAEVAAAATDQELKSIARSFPAAVRALRQGTASPAGVWNTVAPE